MCHVAHAKADTAGKRLFQIRAACGNGERDPESMKAFAERVKAETGKVYDPSTISLLERDKQKWRLEDVCAFAAVDPLNRGRAWLSAFDDLSAPAEQPDPRVYQELTSDDVARAQRVAERERRESTERARNAGGRRSRRKK